MSDQLPEIIPTQETQVPEYVPYVLAKLQQLDNILQEDAPGIENFMLDIANDMKLYPDLVHILTDEEIAPLYQAMVVQSGIQIVAEKTKKSSKTAVPKVSAATKAKLNDLF